MAQTLQAGSSRAVDHILDNYRSEVSALIGTAMALLKGNTQAGPGA